jgi:hypothetical protein
MTTQPLTERTFPYHLNQVTLYLTYLKWLRHLGERLGLTQTLRIWEQAFQGYDDAYLQEILSSGWQIVPADDHQPVAEQIDDLVGEMLLTTNLGFSPEAVREIIGNTPPISHIKQSFSTHTVQREITAYEALHLRFDGPALLAEALIETCGKQGELIVYDLQIETRLAAEGGKWGSVEQFIAIFTAKEQIPSIFTTSLVSELVRVKQREARVHVHQCEWARYFRERHPRVGYLMACSTDEAAYKAFNPDLRMQRTQTLMEGAQYCDFYIYAVENPVLKYKSQWKKGE